MTAQLEPKSEAASSRWPLAKKPPEASVIVTMKSPHQFEVSYTAVSRGQHELHVRVADMEIRGSPFTVVVYPDPTQLAHPVRVVTGLNNPFGVGFTSSGDMVASEEMGYKVSIFDSRGRIIRTFGTSKDREDNMIFPKGIAIDEADNIYVCSNDQVGKFSVTGELTKFVGRFHRGTKDDEFDEPHGITLYDNQVYVCDTGNSRIQVFDADLKFCQSIGSHGTEEGQFNEPCDVTFDSDGNMFVADTKNDRVQVLDSSGRFIRSFGQEGEHKLGSPSGLFVADDSIYISNIASSAVLVYTTSGQFVTSFGTGGKKKGQFNCPLFIAACANGFIHVCDSWNKRIQIF